MALINCPECSKEFSDKAPACPQCGYPMQSNDSKQTGDLLALAEKALAAGNNPEAESYCNRIIEQNQSNCTAWLLKGKAAGWQSTNKQDRLDEALHCFAEAVRLSKEREPDKAERIYQEAKVDLIRIAMALIEMHGNNFAKGGTEILGNSLLASVIKARQCIDAFVKNRDSDVANGYANIATTIVSAVAGANDNLLNLYSIFQHPTQSQWSTLCAITIVMIRLMALSIECAHSNKQENVSRYNFICTITQSYLKACAYKPANSRWGGWDIDYALTNEGHSECLKEFEQFKKRTSPFL